MFQGCFQVLDGSKCVCGGSRGCFGKKGSSGVFKGFKAVSRGPARPQTPHGVFKGCKGLPCVFRLVLRGSERVYYCEKAFLPSESSLLSG